VEFKDIAAGFKYLGSARHALENAKPVFSVTNRNVFEMNDKH